MTDTDTCIRWPAERFYWAVIDGLGWTGRGELPPGLSPLLADEVPTPVEDLHAVASPLSQDGRVVVCACPRQLLIALDPRVTSLCPESIPSVLDSSIEPDRLNLLVGDLEPAPLRAARRRRHFHAAATIFIGASLAALGLARRTHSANAHAADAARAGDALLHQLAPDHRESTAESRVRAMKSIAARARQTTPSTDAAHAFEKFLHSWPASTSAQVQSVSVGPDGISFGVVTEKDPAGFIKSFKAPDGFTLDEPRLAAAGTVTRINLHLRPSASRGGSP